MPKILFTNTLRCEYDSSQLFKTDMNNNPFEQLKIWLDDAIAHPVRLPDAMTLATVTPKGTPDARIVLLKELDQSGLTFFTNYKSPTGLHFKKKPNAACVFWWPEQERQIRILGKVEVVTQKISDVYFQRRPRESQLAAHASPQSKVILNRDWLEQQFTRVSKSFENQEITRPPHWGGYRIIPHTFEFWQGRTNRLHDRLRYRLEKNKTWILERLAP
jgi:pyridoxamine 5'-phosphate oxidase